MTQDPRDAQVAAIAAALRASVPEDIDGVETPEQVAAALYDAGLRASPQGDTADSPASHSDPKWIEGYMAGRNDALNGPPDGIAPQADSQSGVHPNMADSMKWPHGCAYCGGLHVAPQADNPDLRAAPSGLDAAWQEAEAALPVGWLVYGVNQISPGNWLAAAHGPEHERKCDLGVLHREYPKEVGRADNPAAALHALAVRLATPERTEP